MQNAARCGRIIIWHRDQLRAVPGNASRDVGMATVEADLNPDAAERCLERPRIPTWLNRLPFAEEQVELPVHAPQAPIRRDDGRTVKGLWLCRLGVADDQVR